MTLRPSVRPSPQKSVLGPPATSSPWTPSSSLAVQAGCGAPLPRPSAVPRYCPRSASSAARGPALYFPSLRDPSFLLRSSFWVLPRAFSFCGSRRLTPTVAPLGHSGDPKFLHPATHSLPAPTPTLRACPPRAFPLPGCHRPARGLPPLLTGCSHGSCGSCLLPHATSHHFPGSTDSLGRRSHRTVGRGGNRG